MQEPQIKSEIATNNKGVLFQLIVFRAGKEEFGVPIDAVREIIKLGVITPIPNSPDFIKGIINVRGEIVTTIDIKSRFSLIDEDKMQAKHIIVTKQENSLFGLMVDEVIEVLRIQEKEIQPPPAILTRIDEKYVNGVVTYENRLIILLDISKILSQNDIIRLANQTAKQKINKNRINDNGKK